VSQTLLLVSPYFPPDNVLGGKRALHLVRHLPAFGWHPVVLAAPPGRYPEDRSAQAAVPPGLTVDRGFAWRAQRGNAAPAAPPRGALRSLLYRIEHNPYLTPLDQYLSELPGALASATRLVARHRPAAIAVNADPWSGLVVGAWLKRRHGLPFVADLRDPWSPHETKMARRPRPTRAAIRFIEAAVVAAADAVILNSESSLRAYREHYSGRIPPERFFALRNAFDPGLYLDGQEAGPGFSVCFFGSCKPRAEMNPLFEGFARFVERAALRPGDASLVAYALPDECRALARDLRIESYLDARPWTPLERHLRELRSMSALVTIEGRGRELQIAAKLYDYIAARRPILAIAPSAEVGDILRQVGLGVTTRTSEPAEVAGALAALYARPPVAPPGVELDAFTAARLARGYAKVLDSVISLRAASAGSAPPSNASRVRARWGRRTPS
jgi:hypothetical protein